MMEHFLRPGGPESCLTHFNPGNTLCTFVPHERVTIEILWEPDRLLLSALVVKHLQQDRAQIFLVTLNVNGKRWNGTGVKVVIIECHMQAAVAV